MNTVKIEVNGLDINSLAEKIDNLTNALNGQSETKSTTPKDEKLITRMEVARLLGVTLPTVYDWTKKGIITAYRIGNRVRYKKDEIMQTLNNNKI